VARGHSRGSPKALLPRRPPASARARAHAGHRGQRPAAGAGGRRAQRMGPHHGHGGQRGAGDAAAGGAGPAGGRDRQGRPAGCGPAVAPPPLAAPRNRALLCQASGSAWHTLRCGWSGAARKPDVEVWGHANGRADNKQPTPGVQVSSRRGRTRTSTAPPGRALLSYPLALAAACATVLRLGGLRRARARSGGACKTAASRWRRSRPGRSHS